MNTYNHRTVLFISLVFLASMGHAQDIARMEFYTIEEGLPSNQVYEAIQDAQGYLWFGSDRGLIRYDGVDFKVFTTKDGLIDNCILGLSPYRGDTILCAGLSGKISLLHNSRFYDFPKNALIDSLNALNHEYRFSFIANDIVFFSRYVSVHKTNKHYTLYKSG